MNYIHTIYVMYIQIVWMDMDGDGNIWMDIQVFKCLGNTNASAQEQVSTSMWQWRDLSN